MTNGAMNVEIGNPAYKIYEGEPDDDAGELLDADFTLDPDKVENQHHTSRSHVWLRVRFYYLKKIETIFKTYLINNYSKL